MSFENMRPEEREKMLDRIKALLNLADKSRNNSDKEAEVAAMKVQELLEKYNIDMAEVLSREDNKNIGEIIVDEEVIIFNKMGSWRKSLFGCVGDLCGVKGYWYSYPHLKKYEMRFVGVQWDVAVAKELYKFLFKTLDKNASILYKGEYNKQTSYLVGCCGSLYRRVQEQNRRIKEQNTVNEKFALMVISKKEAIDKYMTQKFPKMKTVQNKNSPSLDFHAYHKGRRDGDKIDLGTDDRLHGVEKENYLLGE